MLLRVYFFTGQVLIPNKEYKGQEPAKLVNRKIAATASNTYATVPESTLVKYRMIIAIAIRVRINRSAVPMLCFIYYFFIPKNILLEKSKT